MNTQKASVGTASRGRKPGLGMGTLLAAAGLLSSGTSAGAAALPQGGQLTQGAASVATSATTLTVTQGTQTLGMNWQSFNIGAGNTVQFIQPDSQSVAVNRVIGNDRSEIFGSLKANGQVFLLNPNGVLFGKDAQVDVAGLVASTARNASRNASGEWSFTDKGDGAIVNQGHLRAQDGGFILLDSAREAVNTGSLQANLGGVALTVGKTTTLSLDGNGLLNVSVSGDVLHSLVANQGIIVSEGGSVFLTSKGRSLLQASIVNDGGIIRATSLSQRNGRIFLSGGSTGSVAVSGSIDASGVEKGRTGGTVDISGASVELKTAKVDTRGEAAGGSVRIDSSTSTKLSDTQVRVDSLGAGATAGSIRVGGDSIELLNTTLSASGELGKGEVFVGGGLQGAAVAGLTAANNLAIDAASLIDVTSTGAADAGRVIVWSDGLTRFAGKIDGRALNGSVGGNGGFAEVSGKWKLAYEGTADLRSESPSGRFGDLLLDPYNLTISNSTSAGMNGFDANADDSIISVTDLQAALSAANVTLTTGSAGTQAGDITVANDISWTTDSSLTLTAAGKILVNANIMSTGISSALVLTSNGVGTAGGVSGAGNISVKGVTIHVKDAGASDTYSGAISDVSASVFTQFAKSGAGTLTLTATHTYSGSTSVAGGFLNVNGGGIQSKGELNVNSVGTININASSGFTLPQGAGTINLGSSALLTFIPTGGAPGFGGRINGSGTLEKKGAFSATLGNSLSNFTGDIRLSGGLAAFTLGSGNVTLTGSSFLFCAAGTTGTYGNTFDLGYNLSLIGSGKFVFNGNINVHNTARIDLTGTLVIAGQVNNFGTSYFTTSSNSVVQLGNGGASGQIVGRGFENSGSYNLVFNRTDDLVYSSVFKGINLTQMGSGKVTLTGANTYTGSTAISGGGTLQVGDGGVVGSIPDSTTVTLSGNSTLAFNRTNDATISGVISGAGNLSQLGTGKLSLTGGNSYSGTTTISGGGTIQVGDGGTTGAISSSGAVNLSNSSTLAFNRSDAVTHAGVVSGAGSLSHLGAGKLTLTAANSYSGATVISGGGNLQVGDGGVVGSISASSSVTLSGLSTFSVKRSDAISMSGIVGGGISGSGLVSISSDAAIVVDRTINLTSGTIQVLAGAGTAAGTATGGDVTIVDGSELKVGTTGRIYVFGGTISADVISKVSGPTAGTNKTFNTGLAAFLSDPDATDGTRSFGYRSTATFSIDTLVAVDRVYDATTNVLVNATGQFDGITTSTALTGIVASSNASVTPQSVTVGGSWVSGGINIKGVSLSWSGTTTVVISPKALTVTGTSLADKIYDGTTVAGVLTKGALSGLVSGESLTLDATAGALSGKDVGTRSATVSYTLTGTASGSLGNYSLASTTATVNNVVTPKALTVTGTSLADKIYDGTTVAGVLTKGALSGLVSGESLTLDATAGALSGKDVGTRSATVSYTLTGTASGSLGNYSLASTTATVNNVVTPKALTVTGTSLADKIYDGTTVAGALTLGTLSGLVGTETLTLAGVAGDLSGSEVGLQDAEVSYTLADGLNGGLGINYSLASEFISNEIISSYDSSYAWQAAAAAESSINDYKPESFSFKGISGELSTSFPIVEIETIRNWRKKK